MALSARHRSYTEHTKGAELFGTGDTFFVSRVMGTCASLLNQGLCGAVQAK